MISETISKKVISITEGKCIGTVKEAKFSLKLEKILGYVIFDDEVEVDMFLDAKDVYKESEVAVMIKDQNVLTINDEHQESRNPIGKEVFDVNGICLGNVSDVEVRGLNVLKILLSYAEVAQKDVLFAGNNVIIRAEKEKRNSFLPRKKVINNTKKELPITYTMDISREQKKQEAAPPPRYTTDMKPFVGRRATATVLGYNNELIVRENDFITDSVIKSAKKHNRIPQLIFNSQ